ncbi:hypothetical protein SLE2022_016310 [Rubroshorea leprosula]
MWRPQYIQLSPIVCASVKSRSQKELLEQKSDAGGLQESDGGDLEVAEGGARAESFETLPTVQENLDGTMIFSPPCGSIFTGDLTMSSDTLVKFERAKVVL